MSFSNRAQPGKVERFPALAVRIQTVIPGYWIYPLDVTMPVWHLRRLAKIKARETAVWVYLVLGESRCILFRPDGTYEVSSEPHGYMFY